MFLSEFVMNLPKMNIPFLSFESHDAIRAELQEASTRVIESGWFINGNEVTAFENEWSKFLGCKHSVGVSNGLDALILSLKTLGIGPGDEVIVPSNTYVATALAVTHVGAKPIFVEPNIETYNIDPERIEAAISNKTKAIMPVHLYGQAAEMTAIMQIAERNGLFVVEDNAQAQGAEHKGQKTGTFGHCNGTSFYPGKNLGALGDAGAVSTNNPDLAHKVKVLSNYGSQKKYYNEVVGHNNRLDEMQAAFLRVKLPHLDEWTAQRQAIASAYLEGLQGVGDLILPWTHPDSTHVYHLFVVRTSRRDELAQYLNEHGIGTLIHYPVPPHLQECYKDLGYKRGDFPIAEEIADTALSLPIWPGMGDEQVRHITEAIRSFFID